LILPKRPKCKPKKIKKTFIVYIDCVLSCYSEEWGLNSAAIKDCIKENLPYAKVRVFYDPNNKRKRRKRKAKNT
jgi:hypothetical protein